MVNSEIEKNYVGHRKRVREKFMSSSTNDVFSDYELLEMLLFFSKPRGDVKPLAKKLLKDYKTLANVINAEPTSLLAIKGVGLSTIFTIKLTGSIISRVLKRQIEKKVVLQSWSSLVDYLLVTQGYKNVEQFRVLYLNTKNILIADEVAGEGTVDQTHVYPREIVKRALFHSASSLILVHNHPSGNTNPSKADIEMTKRIIDACSTINVDVHDHLIVTRDGFYSFKSNMLI